MVTYFLLEEQRQVVVNYKPINMKFELKVNQISGHDFKTVIRRGLLGNGFNLGSGKLLEF